MSTQAQLTPEQVKRLPSWSKSRQSAVKRAWGGVCSPRLSIKLQCLECCGEDEASVKGCTANACPLWRFRPFQPKHPKTVPQAEL